MTRVYTGASMSLDGYIAGPEETGFEHLFKWYGNGDVSVPTADPNMTLQMTDVSAKHFRGIVDNTGALVVGGGCSTSPAPGEALTDEPARGRAHPQRAARLAA